MINVQIAGSPNTNTERTKLFRQRVTELGYQRLEVTVGVSTIKNLRTVAKVRKINTYEALELAVALLVRWHNEEVSGNGN